MTESKFLMIFTSLGQCIRFDIDKTREQGRSTRGVRGIKFKHDIDYVVDADVISDENKNYYRFLKKVLEKEQQFLSIE